MIVVGGGAAGLMAAGQAAEAGAETLLIEKMSCPGRKLRITGGGRCNLTNVASLHDFISHLGCNGRFLHQAFSQFFSSDLITFFEGLGVSTVTETGGRVFPAGGNARDVVDALVRWIGKRGVSILSPLTVKRLVVEEHRIKGVVVSPSLSCAGKGQAGEDTSSRTCAADAVIIATGGASYPSTGATGDGYRLAKAAGHKIVPVRPALVPLVTSGETASRLQGVSLNGVKVQLWMDGKKRVEGCGEMLFTHFGVSGPIILSLSRQAVDALRLDQSVTLSIDLKPTLDESHLEAHLLHVLDANGKQQLGTLLKTLLPKKLIPVCMDLIEIPQNKLGHQITALERKRLRTWLKDFRLEITGYRSFNEAMITAGGVDTREVDPRTMGSLLVKGLYFAGEVLDLDADTGGYNLQTAFSTGWVAGRSAARQQENGDTE